jgi:hypothetical protein
MVNAGQYLVCVELFVYYWYAGAMEMNHFEAQPEHIVGACITYKEHQYVANSHLEAMQQILEANDNKLPSDAYSAMHDGFLTSTGRFVERDEARAIAEQAGQVPSGTEAPLQSNEVRFPEKGDATIH